MTPLRPLMAMVLLGACALGPGDSATSRVYRDVGSDQLYDRTVQAMRQSDLRITEADRGRGVIVAVGRYDQRNWATCPDSLRLVDDQSSTQHMVEVAEEHREVKLRASVTDGPEGATLTLEPAFLAEPVGAMATTEECATTGVLERRILDGVTDPT